MTPDRQLQEAVLAQFAWEPSIDAAHIGVAAHDGVVTLSGHVENYMHKHTAEIAAERVRGVKAVVQQLEVQLPHFARRTDEQIARAAVDRLAWDVSLLPDSIKVSVEKGWIRLTGDVAWQYQRESAEQHVRNLFGVVGVSNLTTVKPRANASNISADINVALHRGWFDPERITVTTDGGKVTLSGSVHSPRERWTASSTAWGSPGATSVENDLIIV